MRVIPAGLAALLALLAANVVAGQAAPEGMLVICQPAPGSSTADFVDLSFYLARSVNQTGRYRAWALKRTDPAVQAAIEKKAITLADLVPPIEPPAAHRIAEALDATHVVVVATRNGKDGLGADVNLEVRALGGKWATMVSSTLLPFKPQKKGAILEAINAQVAALVPRICGATQPPPGDAGTTSAKPGPPDQGTAKPGVTPDPPRPTNPVAQPPGASAMDLLVARFRKAGDIAGLIVALRHAVDDDPYDARVRADLVTALRERKLTAEAKDEVQRALVLAPVDARLRRLYADTLLDASDADGAVREYTEAVRLAPKDAVNLIGLGDAYWAAGKPDAAVRAYEDAALADPKGATALRRLARLHVQRGSYGLLGETMKAARERSGEADQAGYETDYLFVMRTLEPQLGDLAVAMQTARKEFTNGTKNREECFKAFTETRGKAQGAADLLDKMTPPSGYVPVQALYSQAVLMIVQACDRALGWLESQSDDDDKEATLLRLEAGRQLAEAGKKLKLVSSRTVSGP